MEVAVERERGGEQRVTASAYRFRVPRASFGCGLFSCPQSRHLLSSSNTRQRPDITLLSRASPPLRNVLVQAGMARRLFPRRFGLHFVLQSSAFMQSSIITLSTSWKCSCLSACFTSAPHKVTRCNSLTVLNRGMRTP
jgi:hypothetical protein